MAYIDFHFEIFNRIEVPAEHADEVLIKLQNEEIKTQLDLQEFCRKNNIKFKVDAMQTVGYLPKINYHNDDVEEAWSNYEIKDLLE